ncbi:MAG: type VII toxin-antitoxin system HepT family RNase toxin [Pseudomonadales bacterium]
MASDIVLNKVATIKRCIGRIREVYADDEAQFRTDYTRQDSVLLNLQRCCEASIDIANVIIRREGLGLPQSARDSFELLSTRDYLSPSIALQMQKMVGLRNVAVHDYQKLNLDIVIAVVERHLKDFERFCSVAIDA